MKQTVTKEEFFDAFKAFDREHNFTPEGLSALFDWLEEYESETGQEIELDVIALCCDWDEYASATDCLLDRGQLDEIDDPDNEEESAREYLNDHTSFIEFDGGILVHASW